MTTYAGLDGMRTAVVDRLKQKLPSYLEQYELELDLAPGTLSVQPKEVGDSGLVPNLISKANRPTLTLSAFPALLVVAYGTLKTELAGNAAAHPAFSQHPAEPNAIEMRKRYRLRIYGFVKAQEYEDTSLARDRLEIVLWRCLTDDAQLGDNVSFDIGSYTSRLSDLANDPKHRSQTLGGWFSEIEMVAIERISAPAVGVADTIHIDESLLAD